MVEIIGENKSIQYTKEELLYDPKIQPLDVVGESLYYLKRKRILTKIGLYVGTFPTINAKDCVFLSLCKSKCDILVVALDSDYSLRLNNKSCQQTDNERAFALSTLTCVDWIVLYDEKEPQLSISKLNPDFIFCGLYENDEQGFSLYKDNLVNIEIPWSKTQDGKSIPFKFFNLNISE